MTSHCLSDEDESVSTVTTTVAVFLAGVLLPGASAPSGVHRRPPAGVGPAGPVSAAVHLPVHGVGLTLHAHVRAGPESPRPARQVVRPETAGGRGGGDSEVHTIPFRIKT